VLGTVLGPSLSGNRLRYTGEGLVLDFDAERKKADALLHALGPDAIQRTSDQADCASLHGNEERAAYWRRVTAHIAVLSPMSLGSE